jgi:hypothetical protein
VTAHSRFGGSVASRYLNCPGSVVLSERAPPRLSSSYAEEGTKAHALAEKCLLNNREKVEGDYPADTIEAVQVYVREVWDTYDADPDAEIYVEEKFVLPIPSAEEGEVFGSNDACIYSPATGRLTVFDYKHGKGVGVSAYENKQLMFYAAGAVASHPEWDVKSIELVIVQPRGPFPDPVSRWEMPLWQLLDYPAQIDAAVRNALSDRPSFMPGDHCRWCPAAEICTVREKAFMEAAALDFDSVVAVPYKALPKPDTLEPDRMAAILQAFDGLSDWVQAIRERVEAKLLAGETIPGFKVVEKQSRRKWAADEIEIAGYLQMMYELDVNDVRPRKLVTITEAEKQLKSKLGKEFTAAVKNDITMKFMVKESTGYACVPDKDKRPAVAPVQAEFGTVTINSLFDDGE